MSSEMIINRENYEEYFLDWLEGRLDESVLPHLRQFLEENPDLAGELQGMDSIRLTPDLRSEMPGKHSLKKKVIPVADINADTIEDRIIASLEGELSPTRQKQLEEFLELNPAFRHDFLLFKKTLLVPEKEIVYPDKEKLKRRPVIVFSRRMLITVASAAAVVLLLIIWRISFFNQGTVPPVTELSWTQPDGGEPALSTEVSPSDEIVQQAIPSIDHSFSKPEDPEVLVTRADPFTIPSRNVKGISLEIEFHTIQTEHPRTELMAQHIDPEEKPVSRNLFGKIIYGIGSRAKERREVLQNITGKKERDGNLDFWNLADLGVKGYNKLADRDIALEVVKDQTGNPLQYTLKEDERVLLTRSRNQQ